MAKRLSPEKFAQYLPEGVTPDKVAAFEAISINTLPVSKKNNLFQDAVHTRQTLLEMAEYVNKNAANHVPVHTDHDQGYALPIGKTIYAKVIDDNSRNYSELRSIFYLDLSEDKLISKVESDTISEVSIGARYKALNCSSCGWDYLGADASEENIWSRTCGNDHQIGTDGVHLMLNGSDRWMEQSLVSLGAANGAKIVAKTQALLGADAYNQLAASGRNPGATTLYASATLQPPEKDSMDLTELVSKLTAAEVAKATLETQLTASKARVAELEPLVAKVAELTAANAALAPVAEITATSIAQLAFVRKEADRLAVLVGVDKLPETAPFADLAASIETNRTKAADKFQAGGRSEPVGTTRSNSGSTAKASLFSSAH